MLKYEDLNFHSFGKNNDEYFYKIVHRYKTVKTKVKIHEVSLYNIEQFHSLYNSNEVIKIIINNKIHKKTKQLYTNNIPMYPVIIYAENDDIYLYITSILLQQIYGLPINKSLTSYMYISLILHNIKKYIGGVITNNVMSLDIAKEGYFAKNNDNFNNLAIKINCPRSVDHIKSLDHGWLSRGTIANLEYVAKTFKPQHILELGIWYGKSSKILLNACPKANLYAFDRFQNICQTGYALKYYNPINEFYMTYSRLETYYKNIADLNHKGDVYMFKGDASKSLDIMLKHKIPVDMIYVDYIKDPMSIIAFLTRCISLFPDAVVVGDDFIFETVRLALFQFSLSLYGKNYIGFTLDSYIISPYELRYYEIVQKEILIHVEHKLELSRGHLLSEPGDIYEFAAVLAQECKFKKLLLFIKKYNLNMNLVRYHNDNTLYHILARSAYETDMPEIMEVFYSIVKPKLIKNIFLLTYIDYLTYKIYLA